MAPIYLYLIQTGLPYFHTSYLSSAFQPSLQNKTHPTTTQGNIANRILAAMATAVRPQSHEAFAIHEDARTEDTEMMAEDGAAGQTTDEVEPEEEEEEEEEQQQREEPAEESSEDEAVDRTVQSDMDKLQADFPGFRDKYRLIKRIGEGMFLLESFS